jgi:hypothetical protein
MKFTKALFTISDNRLETVSILRNKTVFSFDSSQHYPILTLMMKNITFAYGFRYKVESNPNYFSDHGRGTFFFKNLTVQARYSVGKSGQLEVTVNDT